MMNEKYVFRSNPLLAYYLVHKCFDTTRLVLVFISTGQNNYVTVLPLCDPVEQLLSPDWIYFNPTL